jgi:hypothetical protein
MAEPPIPVCAKSENEPVGNPILNEAPALNLLCENIDIDRRKMKRHKYILVGINFSDL